ncbi:hypothetical protein DZD52_18945 [Xanthomonas nasturtii]|uniref:Uncharacterized protein n=1 Tax=Xanthomonas nasturtii TaxID=1843581 RepID=A0A3E1KES3_9XANT|nr:hypothetical protein DZD52_18945 [Xanthomonas nasturtii]
MTCSSVKRFFTSNLLRVGNWTPNCSATQNRGDVGLRWPSFGGWVRCDQYRTCSHFTNTC